MAGPMASLASGLQMLDRLSQHMAGGVAQRAAAVLVAQSPTISSAPSSLMGVNQRDHLGRSGAQPALPSSAPCEISPARSRAFLPVLDFHFRTPLTTSFMFHASFACSRKEKPVPYQEGTGLITRGSTQLDRKTRPLIDRAVSRPTRRAVGKAVISKRTFRSALSACRRVLSETDRTFEIMSLVIPTGDYADYCMPTCARACQYGHTKE